MMMTKAALTMSIVLCGAAVAAAAECQVPKQMKKDQKLPCVRAAAILVPQPTLTLEQLTNGPDFDSADPVKSRFAYFTGADDVACYFPLEGVVRPKIAGHTTPSSRSRVRA